MDLQELHDRTGLNRRKLRYCLDHGLVPGLNIEIAANQAGRPRKFHEDVGFGIVCAATLLELGLRHERIRHFLNGLLEITLKGEGTSKPALVAIFERRAPAVARLGDGVYVRLTVADYGYDSGWVDPAGIHWPPHCYRPISEVVLDLGQILEQLFPSA